MSSFDPEPDSGPGGDAGIRLEAARNREDPAPVAAREAQRATAADPLPDPALDAVRAARDRAHTSWRRYLAVLGVLALLLVGGVGAVWRHSEIRAVHDRTTSVKASVLPTGAPPARLSQAWHTADRAAVGQAVWLDVVVTYSAHSVVGRDARTGTVRWTYSRSDRLICTVAAQDGAAVAIYAHDGNCDEVTSLDIPSGRRLWVRTLFVTGTDIHVSTDPAHVLIVSPNLVELLEPTGGIDWWDEKAGDDDVNVTGCRNRTAVLGDQGVLLASTCPNGERLSLRGPQATKRAWTVALGGRTPLSADQVLSVLSSDRRSVSSLVAGSGKVATTVPLTASVEAPRVPAARAMSGGAAELVTLRGAVLALGTNGRGGLEQLWIRPLAELPLSIDDQLLVPGPLGFLRWQNLDARPVGEIRASGVSADARLDRLGRGVLASDAAGTTAFT